MAVAPFAVSLDVASMVKLIVETVADLIVNSFKFQLLTLAVVLPVVAVNVFTPSESVAPTGICLMLIFEIVSEPSLSTKATVTSLN